MYNNLGTINAKSSEMTMARIKKGLSMNQLANLINSNAGSISRIERNNASPRPDLAKKICAALGCEFDSIFYVMPEKEVNTLKLKDYKSDPEKYKEIKNLCANLNVQVTDETDMAEILDKTNTINAIVAAANKITRRY